MWSSSHFIVWSLKRTINFKNEKYPIFCLLNVFLCAMAKKEVQKSSHWRTSCLRPWNNSIRKSQVDLKITINLGHFSNEDKFFIICFILHFKIWSKCRKLLLDFSPQNRTSGFWLDKIFRSCGHLAIVEKVKALQEATILPFYMVDLFFSYLVQLLIEM